MDKSGISEFIMGHRINVIKGLPKAQLTASAGKVWQDVNGKALEEELDRLIETEDKLRAALEADLKKNEKAAKAVDNAAKSTGDRALEDAGIAVGKGKNRIDNKLILGGTNEATKLSLLGPQTQQELKKQTSILKEIRDATKQTATNTDDIDPNVFDLTEIN
jgi:hypothetical protein